MLSVFLFQLSAYQQVTFFFLSDWSYWAEIHMNKFRNCLDDETNPDDPRNLTVFPQEQWFGIHQLTACCNFTEHSAQRENGLRICKILHYNGWFINVYTLEGVGSPWPQVALDPD